MESSMKVYRRIKVMSDSDTDEPSPNTSSDETSSSTYHSVVDDSSSARRPTSSVRSNQDRTHSIELENNEISINNSSLENTELSSVFKGQIIQCSPDNSCDDKSCDSNEETESDCKLANHVNLMPNTPIKEVLHLSKNSVSSSKDRSLETSSTSSESINLPKSPDLSENPGLFPDCDISPIKSPARKGSTYLKTKNDESFQFTSTQIGEGHNFIKNSSEEDIQSISPAKMSDKHKKQLKGHNSSYKRSTMYKSGFNSQDFQSSSCKTNVKDKSLVQNSSEDEVYSIDNSVTLFDDSKAFLKEDNNNSFKRSTMDKSGFNSPNFHSSSSKMNVKNKSIVPSSSDEEDRPTNNSVIIFDDSKELLKEEHNSDFNNSTIKKSAFNLQDLQASLSKIKVEPKDTGNTSSKLEFTNINEKKDIVNLVTPERLPKKEDPDILKSKIAILEKEIFNVKCTLKTANIALLPDRGVRLQMMVNNKEKDLKILKEELNKLEKCSAQNNVPRISCKQSLHAEFNAQALSNETGVGGSGSLHRVITLDSLEKLHNSLESRPQENVFSDAPKGLKTNVELMPHQKHALAWLMWREKQVPPGGILADDMGLGKTLTMISLILKSGEEDLTSDSREESEDEEKSKSWLCSRKSKFAKGGTLVICPASLLNQWEGEVTARCKSGILKVVVHHGAKRDATGNSLSRFDVVVTTYSIVRSECSKKGALFQVNWKRIILDEAHVVRNYKNQTSVAVCELKAKYRWALTGTPIHNKEVDLFALIKFLRCAPFDEYAWQQQSLQQYLLHLRQMSWKQSLLWDKWCGPDVTLWKLASGNKSLLHTSWPPRLEFNMVDQQHPT